MGYKHRSKEIICPYCGRKHEDEDYRFISYHGTEDGPKLADCGWCGLEFEVMEFVSREWETLPIRQKVNTSGS